VLVEYSKEFCGLLRDRYPGVRVIEGDAYAISTTLKELSLAPAIAVLSSLPLLTRPVEQRLSLLQQCFAMLRPDGPYIQFTYASAAPIPERGANYSATPSRRIWLNVPPARVWVYRRSGQ
jgi:phosphatidylethanolamine/phosphatidyl-N-methylethanolamine N-methyltransferase